MQCYSVSRLFHIQMVPYARYYESTSDLHHSVCKHEANRILIFSLLHPTCEAAASYILPGNIPSPFNGWRIRFSPDYSKSQKSGLFKNVILPHWKLGTVLITRCSPIPKKQRIYWPLWRPHIQRPLWWTMTAFPGLHYECGTPVSLPSLVSSSAMSWIVQYRYYCDVLPS